jgi:plasmid stability protein
MPDLLIRNVPEQTMRALKARAKDKGHSVQVEARDILMRSVDTSGAALVAWLETVRPKGIDPATLRETVAFATAAIREDRDTDHGRSVP